MPEVIPMAAQTLWTEEKLSVVRHLLVDEGLTRAAIAERVGVSKSAIVHAVHRYHLTGLSHHHGTPAKPVAAKPQRINGFNLVAPIPPGKGLRDLPIESSPRAVTFAQYDPCTNCAWPIGHDLFCGRGKFSKSSYCIRHLKRSRAPKL
jgi:hypothetical protein